MTDSQTFAIGTIVGRLADSTYGKDRGGRVYFDYSLEVETSVASQTFKDTFVVRHFAGNKSVPVFSKGELVEAVVRIKTIGGRVLLQAVELSRKGA